MMMMITTVRFKVANKRRFIIIINSFEKLNFWQLQDKATLLTAERKKRGKTMPEGLVTVDDIRAYRQVASHVVRSISVHLIKHSVFIHQVFSWFVSSAILQIASW